MRRVIVASVLFAMLGTATASPRISAAEARKIALVRVPGTVVHEKLKHKKKGHDHYNIKISPRDHAHRGQVRKVEVDADTGQVLKIKDVAVKSDDDKSSDD